MTPHDCTHQGHLWCEGFRPETPEGPHGPAYTRRRDRALGPVRVYCIACPAETELEGHAKFSGPRGEKPIDHTIPPSFMAVLAEAIADAAANPVDVPPSGPAPMP